MGRKPRQIMISGTTCIMMGLILGFVLKPESAGAIHGVHFMAGLMVGIGIVLAIAGFSGLRRA